MAGVNQVGRGARKTSRSNAARSRRQTSGFEQLESRLLMSAVRPSAGFTLADLGIGNDKSFPTSGTAGFSLGFSAGINFYGLMYTGVFVNNNGNISLGARNSFYSNVDLNALPARTIAPFYANVDTTFAGSTVKYGRGTVDGRAAFMVNFLDVDYHTSSTAHTNRNSFQLVMIDQGGGNFDMEFNYDSIRWESSATTGGDANGLGGSTARVGWTANNGTLEGVYQMAGSNVAGSFLDSNLITGLIHNSFMSDVDGRYVYRFRGGTWADAPSTGPTNREPVVTMPETQVVVEDAYGSGSLAMGLMGSFDDPDADNWTATVDYGDGSGPQPLALDGHGFVLNHTYAGAGGYRVIVTVDDGNGGVGVGGMNVWVEDWSAPNVSVVMPELIREGETVTLLASLANDLDANDTHMFDWHGDGVLDGDSLSFAAGDNGTYTIRLVVYDQHFNATTLDVPVTVHNVAPTADGLSGADALDEGSAASFTLAGGTDVSLDDVAAGLIYSFDFDGDGLFEISGASPTASHLFDDNGTYTVVARVTDKDGGYSEYSKQVVVHNVAPHGGSLADDNSVAEGSPVTVSFVGQLDPSAADTAAGFTYSFDFDGDGVYEISGPSASASHTFGDNGTYLVRGRVTDKDGGSTDYATEVEVHNVAPTAMLSAGSAVEGSALTVSLDGASDASAADLAAGLTYSFDLDNDGVFEVSGSSASVSHAFAQDGVHTVRARVTDKDGGSTDYTASVTVTNAAPVVTAVTNSASTLGSAHAGTDVTVGVSFTDAGVLDRHRMVIDWGDGSFSMLGAASSNGSGSASGSHAYAQGGIYTVKISLADDASPAGVATVTTKVYVTGVGLHNGILHIVGTNGNDRARVSKDHRGNLVVKSDLAADAVYSSALVREIHATLGLGRDSFDAGRDVTQPIYLNGELYVHKGGGKTVGVTSTVFSDRLVA